MASGVTPKMKNGIPRDELTNGRGRVGPSLKTFECINHPELPR